MLTSPSAVLFFLLVALSAAFAQPAPPVDGPTPLFDGKTLDGWEGDTAKTWRVEEGAMVGGSMQGNPQNEFLSTKKSYRNFVLKVEYKLVGTEGFVNGGVQFRSKHIPKPPNEMSGYQADIGAGYSGSLYDESRRNKVLAQADKALIAKLEKPGDWNQYEVRAEGNRIRLTLNGQQTVEYWERAANIKPDGVISLQIHGNCKAVISFRNLAIEELPADFKPHEPGPLDRINDGKQSAVPAPFKDGKFDMADNETVVFAGQTNMVLMQKDGSLEARLAVRHKEKKPRFRSMAWEADTVYEQWRDLNFGPWTSQLESIGATMVIAQFGQIEALDGKARLPEFVAAYHRLLDQFAARTPRMVLVSPMPFEKSLLPHAPDLSQRNGDVKAYSEAVREIARQRGLVFIDLFGLVSDRKQAQTSLTDNGMHLKSNGLSEVAELIADQIKWTVIHLPPSPAVRTGPTPAPLKDFAFDTLEDKNLRADHQRHIDSLTPSIQEKNRLWADCWRPANWNFVYGDRITQPFATPSGDKPSLRETFEAHKPLIAALDARIHALANGEADRGAGVPPDAKPDQPGGGQDARAPVAEDPRLSPEAQQATFTMADGYEVNLFASERDGIVKPTQIAWDERGRLYAACSPTYPHLLPGAKPGDTIMVCEDTDRDGKADKFHAFAEGLTMVQGMEPGDGGLYVCDYDQLVHLTDTNSDGKADQRRVVFSGFGTGDTHQLINSITHGPDGSLWFTQGLHAMSRVETPWGLARLDRSGVWRLRPRTLRLDAFFNGAKAGHNCWGVAFDDYGQVFHKSGDRPDGYYSVPGLVRLADPDEYHPIGSLFMTNPKTTALDIIGSKALPVEVQGCAVVGGYMGGVVELHRFLDDGAGFKSEQLPKLLKSTDPAFRPVDVSVGPDGAIYVADWFNPIIGHYQASYQDPKRDKTHGRIWRISAKGRPPIVQPKLAEMKAAELLDQLRSPERWTRYQAKRLLFDAPSAEVEKAADAWVAGIEEEKLLLEVTGVYEAHEIAKPELLARLLAAKDFRVRAYGTRVIGAWAGNLPDPLALLRERIKDENPRVRLEAIVAASYVEKPEAVEVAAMALDSPRDRFIDYALRQSVRALQSQWKTAFAAGSLKFGGITAHADYLRKIAGAATAAPPPGKAIYDMLCMNCHQPGGQGLPGFYPPLVKSEWVSGDKNALIKMLLHGLAGPITVAGQEYGVKNPIPMPPSGLEDQQIAEVLTFIRSNFGHQAPPVSTGEVEAIRAPHKDRANFWTVEELKK